MPLEDSEVSQALERSFTRRGMTVMTNARFDAEGGQGRRRPASRSTVGPEGKEASKLTAELMLVATGRAPNVEDVGLETTKAELERGFVKVDPATMRTREPHLYAIGDVIGGLMLAHTAGHEGILAAHTIAGDKDIHPMDYVQQPRATYCRPEIASVGLTEQQCEERGLPYKVGKVPFQAIAKAIIGGEYEGFAKVIGNTETGDTLGVHVIGPHATDLIAEATLAFTLEATPVGDRRRDPRRTRRSPRSSARRRWPSTAGRSTSDRQRPDASRWPTNGRTDGRLASASSPRPSGSPTRTSSAMYRVIATARAVDERMWILNRAGRIPFVISGQGHEGAQAAIAWPLAAGQRLDRAVLPLDRDLPDVRHDARGTS